MLASHALNQKSRNLRQQEEESTRHTAIVLGIVTGFMGIAIWWEWPWWEYAFLSDGSAVAWLSSALLLADAAVALAVTLTCALPTITGGAISAALALLAMDEQFELHEQFKSALGTSRFRDAPTVVVGIGGVVLLVVLWQRLTNRTARGLFVLAISVGVFALWVDLGSPPVLIGRVEEGFEVLAESLFLCGLLELARTQVQSGSAR